MKKIIQKIISRLTIRSGSRLLFIFASSVGIAQPSGSEDILSPPSEGYRCRAELLNGDTVPVVDLNNIDVCTNYIFRNRRTYEKWDRTKRQVKRVYPYAILAAAKLKEYDKALEKMPDEHMRKAFLKHCEKDLRREFEDELKALSPSEGRILMKLIDRESGKTTFQIVEQLRGSFQAVMWNALATLFGNNMKAEYDPIGDILIERAIKLVEAGAI